MCRTLYLQAMDRWSKEVHGPLFCSRGGTWKNWIGTKQQREHHLQRMHLVHPLAKKHWAKGRSEENRVGRSCCCSWLRGMKENVASVQGNAWVGCLRCIHCKKLKVLVLVVFVSGENISIATKAVRSCIQCKSPAIWNSVSLLCSCEPRDVKWQKYMKKVSSAVCALNCLCFNDFIILLLNHVLHLACSLVPPVCLLHSKSHKVHHVITVITMRVL